MWISVDNVVCRVTNATADELRWVERYLTFQEGAPLFKMRTQTFPGGLLPLLRDAASRDGHVIELLDKRSSRITPDPNADLAWLRDYQRDAVEACAAEKRGIIRAPTGSGKGDMIVGVVRRLPGRWLFLVHRDNLVSQQARRFAKYGSPANVLSRTPPAEWVLAPGINLMTLQTLASAIRRDREAVDRAFATLDGVIVDECHVAPADVYFSAINRCPAEYRFGFSGTPLDRTDNRSLMAIAALGKVIYQIKAKDLIDAGHLAMPTITMVPVSQMSPPGTRGGPSLRARSAAFRNGYDALVVGSALRNTRIAELAKTAAKPCMVFVKAIEHGKELAKMLQASGMTTEFVWGSTRPEARDQAVERLVRRDADVLVASVVFQEGVDVPNLRSVIIASGGKSVIAALQRIGRGMRTDDGRKQSFEVYDILDKGSPMLERHARRRMNTYVRESYTTVVRDELGVVKPYQPKLLTRREKRGG